jgi:hypothetical protein
MSKQKPVKQSNFVDSPQLDPKKHAIMVDRDLSHLFLYAGSLPQYATIGTVAPTSTPQKIGDTYINTALTKVYISCGTSSSADWIILN